MNLTYILKNIIPLVSMIYEHSIIHLYIYVIK